MKTSNKILLGLLVVILLFITVVIAVVARNFRSFDNIEPKGNATRELQVPAFCKLDVDGKFKVTYKQDTFRQVIIHTDSSLLDLVESSVSDNTLFLHARTNIPSRRRIEVEVVSDSLVSARLHAGGSLKTQNKLKVTRFEGSGSAGAVFDVDGDFSDLGLNLQAGAVGNFSGKCRYLELNSSAGSVLNAEELTAENGKVSSSAGSVNNIFVSGELDIHASAGSIVRCKGNPRIKNIDISSGAQFVK